MRKVQIGYIAALLLFGSNGIYASMVQLSSYEIVFFRTLLGTTVLLTAFFLTGHRFTFYRKKRDFLLQALSGIANAANWIFLFEGYQLIGVSIPILLCYCGPVIVMALSPLLFKEKLTTIKLIAFASVLVGIFLLNGTLSGTVQGTRGVICGILSGVMFAALAILNKKAAGITGLEKSVLQLVFCLLTVSVFLLCKQGLHFQVAPTDWLPLLLLGAVNTGAGSLLYYSAMGKLPVQTTAVLGYLEPLSSLLLSVIFLNEHMSTWQLVGAVMILGGVMLAELWHPRSRDRTRAQGKSVT